MNTITVRVELSIGKPVKEVFQAVVMPTPYFIHRASGPIKQGAEVVWEFAELAKEFSIHVRTVVPNKLIRFEWPRGAGTAMNSVECTFKPFSPYVTTVFLSESGWPNTATWRKASYRNGMGWMHMLCSLKAHLEYGINLRTGSFVHMKFE